MEEAGTVLGGRFPAGVGRFWARGTRGCEEVRSGRLSVVKWVAETHGWGTVRPFLSPVTRADQRQR